MFKSQIIVILCAITLFVLLFFAGTSLPKKKETVVDNTSNYDNLINEIKKELSKSDIEELQTLEQISKRANPKEKVKALENLLKFWDGIQKPQIASYYAEQIALAEPHEKNWFQAGERYFRSVGFSKPEDRQLLYERAIFCFKKALELKPDDIEAKVKLASCYVEGTPDPMKGIGMLRDIVSKHPDNLEAQLNLGFFAVKSNQLDKAIERFNKVIEINPGYIEAYLFLADVYRTKGDKAKAIESLKKYQSMVDDSTIKTEVEKYINQLKSKL